MRKERQRGRRQPRSCPGPQASWQVLDWPAARGVGNAALLLTASVWDAEANRRASDPRWKGFSFGHRFDYMANYANPRRMHFEVIAALRRGSLRHLLGSSQPQRASVCLTGRKHVIGAALMLVEGEGPVRR